jgi:nucleotide-binding universal stress UspA family protein
MQFDSVVVGVDGSPGSQTALKWACSAVKPGGRIIAGYGYGPRRNNPLSIGPASIGASPGVLDTAVIDLLAGPWTELAAEFDVEVEHAIRSKSPSDTLLELAATNESPMIALGSHSESVLGMPRLGGVVGGIMSAAEVPLTLIPPYASNDAPQQRNQVVVGIDRSPASVGAFKWAIANFDPEIVTALEIIAPPADESLIDEVGEHEAAVRSLEAFIETAIDDEVPVGYRVAASSTIDEMLRQSATADLLVVGAHPRSIVQEYLAPSIVRLVAPFAQCPMCVIPPPTT